MVVTFLRPELIRLLCQPGEILGPQGQMIFLSHKHALYSKQNKVKKKYHFQHVLLPQFQEANRGKSQDLFFPIIMHFPFPHLVFLCPQTLYIRIHLSAIGFLFSSQFSDSYFYFTIILHNYQEMVCQCIFTFLDSVTENQLFLSFDLLKSP